MELFQRFTVDFVFSVAACVVDWRGLEIRLGGGRYKVLAVSDEFVKFGARSLHFMDGVVFVLLGFRIVKAVVDKAHEGQVVFCSVRAVPVQMSNLTVLFH